MSLHHRRHYAAIALGGLATVGLWEGAKGVLLPHFQAELSLSAAAAASIFSASAIGVLIGSFSFGPLSQRFGLRQMSAAAAGLVLLLVMLFFTLGHAGFLYGAFVAWGLAISSIELATHLPISVLYKEEQGGVLNLLHGFFGIGALAGSLWGAVMLDLGAGWRLSVALVGAALIGWVLYFNRLPAVELPRTGEGEKGGYGPVLQDPLVWAAALALFAAVVGEVGVGLFLPSYLQRVRGFAGGASAMAATFFFGGFTVARLMGSWLVTRLGNTRAVVLTALLGGTGLTGMLLLGDRWVWLAALAGAGIGITFATCLTLVAIRHPSRVNTVYSLMYAFGGLAGIVTGPLMGWAGDRVGFAAAMWIPLGCYAAIALLITWFGWASGRRALRREPRSAA